MSDEGIATAENVLPKVEEFQEGQWWLNELDAMVANGTVEQKQAVAVVRNLLRTSHRQVYALYGRLNQFNNNSIPCNASIERLPQHSEAYQACRGESR
jgi:hypothetical protein